VSLTLRRTRSSSILSTLKYSSRMKESMKRALSCLIMLMLSTINVARAETFHKTKVVDAKGKEASVEVDFDKEKQSLTVSGPNKKKPESVSMVPYGAIEKLSYERSARHRVKEGAVVMIASLGAGAVVMLTKSKNHWLYVDYKQDGTSKNLTLKLDKGEYEKVLKTAAEQTGKQVEKLTPQKDGKGDSKD
jgi:hypothetical protein